MEVGEGRRDFYDRARELTQFVTARTPDVEFIVPTSGQKHARELFAEGRHPEIAALEHAVHRLRASPCTDWPSGLTMLDLGAGVGLRAVPAVVTHRFGRVVASNTDPEEARLLRVNARLNGAEAGISALPVSLNPNDHEAEVVTLQQLARRGLLEVDEIALVWLGLSAAGAGEAVVEALGERLVPMVVETGDDASWKTVHRLALRYGCVLDLQANAQDPIVPVNKVLAELMKTRRDTYVLLTRSA